MPSLYSQLHDFLSMPFILTFAYFSEKVSVKCNQTGKLFRVKVTTLSRNDDDDLTMDDLVEGSQLLLTMSGKSYPVTVLRVIPALTDVTAESKSYYINFVLYALL